MKQGRDLDGRCNESRYIRKSVEKWHGGLGVLAARAQEVGERDRERLPVVREGGDLTAGGARRDSRRDGRTVQARVVRPAGGWARAGLGH